MDIKKGIKIAITNYIHICRNQKIRNNRRLGEMENNKTAKRRGEGRRLNQYLHSKIIYTNTYLNLFYL